MRSRKQLLAPPNCLIMLTITDPLYFRVNLALNGVEMRQWSQSLAMGAPLDV